MSILDICTLHAILSVLDRHKSTPSSVCLSKMDRRVSALLSIQDRQTEDGVLLCLSKTDRRQCASCLSKTVSAHKSKGTFVCPRQTHLNTVFCPSRTDMRVHCLCISVHLPLCPSWTDKMCVTDCGLDAYFGHLNTACNLSILDGQSAFTLVSVLDRQSED